MTWSLALKNGDLSLGTSHGFETVDNEHKLVQDLRCNLLERLGEDPLHPDFGSTLDGGVTPDGVKHNGFIGEINNDMTQLEIQSEVTRVINNYQERTLMRAKSDKVNYGKATLTQGEVLYALNDVKIQNYFDQINIMVKFTSGSAQTQTLDVTV